jgi:hypothetical protein
MKFPLAFITAWLIFFSPEKKMIWFRLAGFLMAREDFITAVGVE